MLNTIKKLNQKDFDKKKLTKEVQKITGHIFNRFDQLYLKKKYIERFEAALV